MFTPCLLIREPEMIKRITSEDFKFFQNNDVYIDKDIDKIMGRNPFVLRDTDWKSTRPLLTPCFSPNRVRKKIRHQFQNFNCICTNFSLPTSVSVHFVDKSYVFHFQRSQPTHGEVCGREKQNEMRSTYGRRRLYTIHFE